MSRRAVVKRRDALRGLRIVEEPQQLRHFTARLAPARHAAREGRDARQIEVPGGASPCVGEGDARQSDGVQCRMRRD